jgi:Spy/CpxP family protein refolding chaperone
MRRQHLSALLAIGLTMSVLAAGSASIVPAVKTGTAAAAPSAQSAAQTPGSGANDPAGPPAPNPPGGGLAPTVTGSGPAYTISQAVSDRAQLDTIAFDALGFLTGTLGSDSFFPPGKVADFSGFQYLRDNDPSGMGHNTDFLTSASLNMLTVLTEAQRQQLIALATSQVGSINDYAYKRFVLMKAFRRLLAGDLPAGTTGLDESAVEAYSAQLYTLDGTMSYARAAVMGPILDGLTSDQRAYLDAMAGKGMTSWPTVQEPSDLRGLSQDEKVAVMTYAGDMFSWHAGSVEADTYFCPERHGTYFGSFYLKDAPAVGNPGYSIGTTITGDMGAALLSKLTSAQAALITGLVDAQRADLARIVETRRAIATDLSAFKSGGTADSSAVEALMKTYGDLDGSLAYRYATAFAAVGETLTTAQRADLAAMRTALLGNLSTPSGAYLYSQPIPMPTIPNTDFLFGSAGTASAGLTASPVLRMAGGTSTHLSTAYGTEINIRSGASVTLKLALTPATANVLVRVYRRAGRTGPWTLLASGRTNAAGILVWSRAVSVPAAATGYDRSVYFRVSVPGTASGSVVWSNLVWAVVA